MLEYAEVGNELSARQAQQRSPPWKMYAAWVDKTTTGAPQLDRRTWVTAAAATALVRTRSRQSRSAACQARSAAPAVLVKDSILDSSNVS